MIYLDHATTSWPKAAGVAEAMAAALALPGSAGRGAGGGARTAGRIADDLRKAIARVVHAADPSRIVLTAGATDGLNRAILGVVAGAAQRGQTPHIVTTQVEHNAVRRPILGLGAEGRARVTVVPAGAEGVVDADAVVRAARGATLVAMMWASNVTGAIQPVEEVAAALRGTETLLLVDASQTVGLVRPAVPLERLGIDLLAFSGHKALGGPPGVGALYVGPRAHPDRVDERAEREPGLSPLLWPVVRGGTGLDSRSASMPAELPHRFEAGTPNTPAYAGLLAAMAEAPAPERALAHAQRLMAALQERLAVLAPSGVRLLGPASATARVGVLAIALESLGPDEAAGVLESEFGIIVRAGWHCAPGVAEALGPAASGGVVRLSVGNSTTEAEIEAAAAAIGELAAA